ncbi:MAG: hypothetical protein ACD_73C00405G0006 [uncultured bacterium]|nr:MAG: hypothetical protein ACD_73C00405G0006 [uncultured bacterium]
MTEENIYIKQRQDKAKQLREKGINPYPNGIKPNVGCGVLACKYHDWEAPQLEGLQETFVITGRMIAARSFGKAGFIKLRDYTGEMQVFCQKDSLPEQDFDIYKNFAEVGDFIIAEGHLFRTKTNELTLKASKIGLVTKTIRMLPEKWHGLTDVEARYRQRYVDLIANPEVKNTFIKRSKIINHIRQFLIERNFLEVETPMMHPIPGGAAAKPFETHHNTLDMDLFLRIAPELYLKRLVVGGLERVFEINRNFRNEGVSIQHNPEFTMLEFYMSYSTFEDLMNLTEEMLGSVAKAVCGSAEISYQDTKLNFNPPFKRISLKDSLAEVGDLDPALLGDENYLCEVLQKTGYPEDLKGEPLGVIQTTCFEHLVEKKLIQPTFITHFPTVVSPLARRNEENPDVTDRFELYIFGREIANAFSELNDPEDQKNRFLKQVEARESGDDEAMFFDGDYITALEFGMPPTAGEGIGIDRLVMLLTDAASIRDVILFPLLRTVR